MIFPQVLFIVIAACTLGSALMVVTSKNLIHAALWLVVALFGIAVVFVMLQAGYLAIVQIVVYIGAIAILMIFAIMMTRKVYDEPGSRYNSSWIWALVIAVIFFGAVSWLLSQWTGFSAIASELNPSKNYLKELGTVLVSPQDYVLPFEVASILLLAALIGAIVVAGEKK